MTADRGEGRTDARRVAEVVAAIQEGQWLGSTPTLTEVAVVAAVKADRGGADTDTDTDGGGGGGRGEGVSDGRQRRKQN